MSSQLLLKFRYKKGENFFADGLDLFFHGFIDDLDLGLQSVVVVGKPLGYPQDGSTQPRVVVRDLNPNAVNFTDSHTPWVVETYEGDRIAWNRTQDPPSV